jgi:8-oxo-dGTP diphosphatase
MSATPPVTAAAAERVADVDWASWRPNDYATLLFVHSGGRLLLIEKKRGLGAGLINAPGGKLDPGETPRQAALREVHEELCVQAWPPRWCGEHRFQFRDGYAMHVHVYLSEGCDGTPTETDEAIPMWVDADAVPYQRMWPDDVLWMPLMLRGQRFSGHYLFDGGAMVDVDIRCLDDDEADLDIGFTPGSSA